MKTTIYFLAIASILLACDPPKKTQVAEIEQAKPIEKTVKPNVLIETEFGNMAVVLYDETPLHKENFLKLANAGFFNDLLFHRVINGFMIQGGDPDSKNAVAGKSLGMGGPGYTINAEFNPKFIHKKGALSAARTGGDGNPLKKSSGSQFYIVQGQISNDDMLNQTEKRNGITYTAEQRTLYKTIGGTPFLDNDYTVFGEVISGLDVIDKIAAVEKNRQDRPLKDVKMTIKVLN